MHTTNNVHHHMMLPRSTAAVTVIVGSREMGSMDDANEPAIRGAREALNGFMEAFNREDAEAIRTRWFHFPHVRFHSGKVTVMATVADYHNLVWSKEGQSAGWNRTT